MQNEAVLEDVTPAWSIYARSLLFGALLLLAGLAEAAVSDAQDEASGAAIMGIVVFAVIVGYAYYRRSRTHYVVTDGRVVKRTGLFLSTNIEEAGYEMITGVGTDESRFQSLFGNGTVQVATSGGIGTIELVGAPNAKDLANLIRSRHPTLGTRGHGAPRPGAGPGGRPAGNRGAPPGGGNVPQGRGGQRRPPQGQGGQQGPPQGQGRQQPPQSQGRQQPPQGGQPPTGEPQRGRRPEGSQQAPQNGGRQGPPKGGGEPPRGQPGAQPSGDRREEPTERRRRERERSDEPAGGSGDRPDGEETDEETGWDPDRTE
jgi:membrane protein YdbS with pleckstrin-like domain